MFEKSYCFRTTGYIHCNIYATHLANVFIEHEKFYMQIVQNKM